MSEPGTVIGQLTTEDEDLDQTHTYTLMDNAGGRVLLNGTTLQVKLQKIAWKWTLWWPVNQIQFDIYLVFIMLVST